MQLAQLRQVAHKLEVALDFYHSTAGAVGRADFQRAVAVVTGRALPEHVVSMPQPAPPALILSRLVARH